VKAFTRILIKELKSMIRDPKIIVAMIITPFILVGIMYAVMLFSFQQAVEEATEQGGTVVLLNNDHGYWAGDFIEFLRENGYKVVEATNRDELAKLVQNREVLGGIVIPQDFTANITRNRTAYLELYVYLASPSIAYYGSRARIDGIVYSYSRNLSDRLAEAIGIDPSYMSSPVSSTYTVLLRDKVVKVSNLGEIASVLILASMMVPLVSLVLASFLVQLTATSIAVEKEEKMFETLLSLPISRFGLILAKITAVVIVGLIGVSLYGSVLLWYFQAVTSLSSTAGASQPGMSSVSVFSSIAEIYGSQNLMLLVLALLGFVLFILALSMILALFAEDVRSAQMITGYIIMPIAILMFVNMFLDVSTLPATTKCVLALIPIANTGFISSFIFMGENLLVYLAVVSSITYALITIYMASRLVSTEKVFTLRLFRRRR